MNRLKALFLMIFVFLAASLTVSAQKVTFNVEAPAMVAAGEVFRVEFISNTNPGNFIAPDFEEGIEVLAGPSKSVSRSVFVDNGDMVQENKYSYVYVLQCAAEGEFTVSGAAIEVGKDSYYTKPLTIKVIREQAEVQASQGQKTTIEPDDLFVTASVDKSKVFKGEPVKLTFKLYSRVSMADCQPVKAPVFNGFWSQQILSDGYSRRQREEYKDKLYTSWVVAEYLLFPQIAGSLTIDPFELVAVAQIAVQQKPRSILDDFFGGANVQEVRRKISTQPLKITVIDLPAGAPKSFNGAVGEFEMTSETLPAEISANSATAFTLKISGNGNLPQIQAPKLSLPLSFEQYNVKTTETLNNTVYGIYGYRQFEYPMIARVDGDYSIPPVEFTFFNPKKAKYETLTTEAITIRVTPDASVTKGGTGIVGGISKENVKMLGKDIRFIKLGSHNLRSKNYIFMGSGAYCISLIVAAGLFVFLFVYLRNAAEQRRNIAVFKGKQANKVALLRFRAAESHMKDGNQRGFYEEMLKALWGYMGDKLNIPVSNLTKENVREELIKKGVPAEQASHYITIISNCEYAQYAPSVSARMNDIYAAGVEVISKIESVIGR